MYKIFGRTLLFIALPMLTILAMEEQSDVSDLLKILKIQNPPALFYEALPIVEKYDEKDIKNLEIEPELKKYALELKNKMNKKLFDPLFDFLNIEEIKILLDFGANINAENERGGTLLSIASKVGNPEYVDSLLKRGANPNIKTKKRISPLIEAAMHLGPYKTRNLNLIKTAKLLIQNKANVNTLNKEHRTALSFAAEALSDKMVELLLENEANPNIEDNDNLTPLMYVANETTTDENKQAQLNIITMLIKHDARLFKTNFERQTAYDMAKDKGNTQIAHILWLAMQKRGKEIYGLQNVSKNE